MQKKSYDKELGRLGELASEMEQGYPDWTSACDKVCKLVSQLEKGAEGLGADAGYVQEKLGKIETYFRELAGKAMRPSRPRSDTISQLRAMLRKVQENFDRAKRQ